MDGSVSHEDSSGSALSGDRENRRIATQKPRRQIHGMDMLSSLHAFLIFSSAKISILTKVQVIEVEDYANILKACTSGFFLEVDL